MNRVYARRALRTGIPLRVRINREFSVTVQADIFSGKIYATLKENSAIPEHVYPRTRMTVLETLQFIKANYERVYYTSVHNRKL